MKKRKGIITMLLVMITACFVAIGFTPKMQAKAATVVDGVTVYDFSELTGKISVTADNGTYGGVLVDFGSINPVNSAVRIKATYGADTNQFGCMPWFGNSTDSAMYYWQQTSTGVILYSDEARNNLVDQAGYGQPAENGDVFIFEIGIRDRGDAYVYYLHVWGVTEGREFDYGERFTYPDTAKRTPGSRLYLPLIGVPGNSIVFSSADHTFDKQVATEDFLASPADCGSPAKYYYSCECGEKVAETFEVGEINPDAHNHGEWIPEVPANVNATGMKGHYLCGCGKYLNENLEEVSVESLVTPQKTVTVYDFYDLTGKSSITADNGTYGGVLVDFGSINPVNSAVKIKATYGADTTQFGCMTWFGNTVDSGMYYWQQVPTGVILYSDIDRNNIVDQAGYGQEVAGGDVFVFEIGIRDIGSAYVYYLHVWGVTEGREFDYGERFTYPDTAKRTPGSRLYLPLIGVPGNSIVFSSVEHTFDRQVESEEYLVTGATCSSAATYYYSCECGLRSDATFTVPGAVDPNAHDYSEWTEIPANVNTAGMKGHYHCSLCDKYFDADYAEVERDSLIIEQQTVTVYDFYDLTGKSSITADNDTYGGVLVDFGTINPVNSAVKMKATYGADTNQFGSMTWFGNSVDSGMYYWQQVPEGVYLYSDFERNNMIDMAGYAQYAENGDVFVFEIGIRNVGNAYVYYLHVWCVTEGREFDYGERFTFIDSEKRTPGSRLYLPLIGVPGNSIVFGSAEHTFDRQVESEEYLVTGATCTTAGTYYYSCECGLKGDITFTIDGDVDPNAHTYGEWIEEIPATCVAEGQKAHYHCECGKYFDENFEELDSIVITDGDHIYGEWIAEKPATCLEDGEKGHYHCSACEKDFDENFVELESLTITGGDHDYGDWIDEIPATTEETGVKGHYHCSVCEANFDAEYNELDRLTIEKLPSQGNESSSEPSVAPESVPATQSGCFSSMSVEFVFGGFLTLLAMSIVVMKRRKNQAK